MKKVVILGGGIAGMSAAHELVERGFTVEVYEMKAIPGGKARSIPFVNSVLHRPQKKRQDLPGEHGFRFFPRFYKHVVDTMARIPYGKNGRWVIDNLVDTTRVEMARYGKLPIVMPTRSPRSLGDLRVILDDFYTLFEPDLGISREDMAFFGSRIWQIITSCQERRNEEYEKLDWWDFIDADARSDAYQKFLGYGITRSLVAAKARLASTKTIGDIFVQLLFDIARPGASSDRVLSGPTNEVWINPWLDYLRSRGVAYHLNAPVKAIHCADGRIQSATIEKEGVTSEVQGDYYIAAVPVEKMMALVTPEMLSADPRLANLTKLGDNGVSWMNGIQFYLTQDVPINHGHTIYVDSPWALTSVSQQQFWRDFDVSKAGDGDIRGILSVDISEWDQPGLNGKTAKQCSRDEIRSEVWAQLKRSLNVCGRELLRDEYLHDFFLDPGIFWKAGGTGNEEPLLVNLINTWQLRPEAVTQIPNFFLAADYVRTFTDLATMEGANEAARRAVNGILEASNDPAPRCGIWNLMEPEIFAPWREMDRLRYQQGLPWDDTLVHLSLTALDLTETAIRLLEQSLGMSLATPLNQARDIWMQTGGAPAVTTGPIARQLDNLEAPVDILGRLENALRILADPVSQTTLQAWRTATLPDSARPSPGATSAQRVRSGRVRIIPK